MYKVQIQPDETVTLANGSIKYPLVTLKDEYGGVSHIIKDDGCYVLMNDNKFTHHWYLEAAHALKNLIINDVIKESRIYNPVELTKIDKQKIANNFRKYKLAYNTKPDGSRDKPVIFTYTTYRLPTDEELEEFKLFPNLIAKDIVNGFYYTIVGKSIENQEHTKMVKDSIKLLINKYPDNEEYQQAYYSLLNDSEKFTYDVIESRKPNGKKSKPVIFTYTTYRLPTDEELDEFKLFPNLTAKDIIDGFGYTIIGRGFNSKENEKKIEDSIKLLLKKYPDNKEYQQAYYSLSGK